MKSFANVAVSSECTGTNAGAGKVSSLVTILSFGRCSKEFNRRVMLFVLVTHVIIDSGSAWRGRRK